MRFTQTVFALVALTSSVFADVTDPTPGFDAITNPSVSGQSLDFNSTFEINWSAATYTADTDTVSIILLAGDDPATLFPGDTIASLKNSVGTYSWKVPSSTAKTYGFKIVSLIPLSLRSIPTREIDIWNLS